MSGKTQEINTFLICEFLQETATDDVKQKNINLDKTKNMEDVNMGNSCEDLLDGAQQKTDEEDINKHYKPQIHQHLLSDWRSAIHSQPKIKQPGDQGDGRINQSKVRFSIFQNNGNSKQNFIF